jgi:hypothetical protein
MIHEPDYTVELITDADVGILLLKDWFEWADESKLLAAGMRLIFCLRSEVTYKNKVNYCLVAVAGDVLVRDHLGSLVKVAYVDFERDESQGNPVVAYLQRHGSAKSAPIPLTTEYHLMSDSNSSLYREPLQMSPIPMSPTRTPTLLPLPPCLVPLHMGCLLGPLFLQYIEQHKESLETQNTSFILRNHADINSVPQ